MHNNSVVESTAVSRNAQSRNRRFRLTESYPQGEHKARNEAYDRTTLVARRQEHAERV